MYYKAKKRRESRYWWRRMWSRKYRPLLIKKTIQIMVVTVALTLLALLTTALSILYFLVWCLIVGIIIFHLQRELSNTEFIVIPRKMRKSRKVSKPRKIKAIAQRTAKTPLIPIKEVPPKKIESESPKTSHI
jgi:hypothetical protein